MRHSGNTPLHRDWLIMYVSGDIMNSADIFKTLFGIPSIPGDLRFFKLSMIFKTYRYGQMSTRILPGGIVLVKMLEGMPGCHLGTKSLYIVLR